MTEKQLFQGYRDLLRMSSESYRGVFLWWLYQHNADRYVRFCKVLGEEPQHAQSLQD